MCNVGLGNYLGSLVGRNGSTRGSVDLVERYLFVGLLQLGLALIQIPPSLGAPANAVVVVGGLRLVQTLASLMRNHLLGEIGSMGVLHANQVAPRGDQFVFALWIEDSEPLLGGLLDPRHWH